MRSKAFNELHAHFIGHFSVKDPSEELLLKSQTFFGFAYRVIACNKGIRLARLGVSWAAARNVSRDESS